LLPRSTRTIARSSEKSSKVSACSRVNQSAISPTEARCAIPQGLDNGKTVRRGDAFGNLDWVGATKLTLSAFAGKLAGFYHCNRLRRDSDGALSRSVPRLWCEKPNMRSAGIPAALWSGRAQDDGLRAGFTLLEALVALALLLAFASTLGPYMFHSRRVIVDAESRVAAQVLLRTLLDAPFDRTSLAGTSRNGELGKLRWRIVTEPLLMAAPRGRPSRPAFRVMVSVAWGPEQVVAAETMRLGKPE
jgi:hypothetical protein